MKIFTIAAAALLFGLGAARADDAQPQLKPPLDLPAHAQPTQGEIKSLPSQDRSGMSVDLSPRAGTDVDALYRRLMSETAPPRHARTTGSGD